MSRELYVFLVIGGTLLGVALVFFFVYLVTDFDWNKFRSRFRKIEKNQLSFFLQDDNCGSYSCTTKIKFKSIDKIIDKFKKSVENSCSVGIESEFNKNFYPVFDLDEPDQLILFKKIYAATPYVLFQSSTTRGEFTDHYWAIIDLPYKKMKDIFYEHNWKSLCNDSKFIKFCRYHNRLMIRGLYEDKNRKPCLHTINGILSKNFQLFIDKLCIYYNKEGFELSILRYQNPEMLIKFNRKLKLEQLNNLK